jgi:circadian clock protein KaiB
MREDLLLRLYVAGHGPNSLEAIRNLRQFAATYLHGEECIEIVDVVREPGRALSDQVLLTPTLVRVRPAPPVRIIGTLRETSAVLAILGIEPQAPPPPPRA